MHEGIALIFIKFKSNRGIKIKMQSNIFPLFIAEFCYILIVHLEQKVTLVIWVLSTTYFAVHYCTVVIWGQ